MSGTAAESGAYARILVGAIFLIGCGYFLAASDFTQCTVLLIPSIICLGLAYLLLRDLKNSPA